MSWVFSKVHALIASHKWIRCNEQGNWIKKLFVVLKFQRDWQLNGNNHYETNKVISMIISLSTKWSQIIRFEKILNQRLLIWMALFTIHISSEKSLSFECEYHVNHQPVIVPSVDGRGRDLRGWLNSTKSLFEPPANGLAKHTIFRTYLATIKI